MTNKFLVVSIGKFDIKLIKVRIKKEAIWLSDPFIIKVPQTLVQNGRMTEPDVLKSLLKDTLKQMGTIYRKTVLLLNDSLILSREMELPDAKPQVLESMVITDASGYLPSDTSEYTIRYKILMPSSENPKKLNLIMMSSIKTELVMDFYSILQKSGLRPVAVDTNINGMIKFFKRYLKGLYNKEWKIKTSVLFNIGASNATLIIFQKGIPVLQNVFTHSSQMIDVLISNSMEVSVEEAEKYKIKYGIEYLYTIPDDSLCAKVGVVINSQLDILLSDVYHFIDDYNYKNPLNQIENIWISGAAAKMKGLSRYITESFSIPCDIVQDNPLMQFTPAKIIDKEESKNFFPVFTSLIGAAIRGE